MHLKFVYENPFKVKVVYIFFHILCLPVGCSLTSHSFSLVQFSHSVMSDSLQLHGLTRACQASLSINNSRSLLKLMSIEAVMPSNHLLLCHPLLLPSIFPSIRVFSNNGNSDRLFLGVPKSLQMVTAAMKLKDACSLKEKV